MTNSARFRSPRGRSPSGKMSRQPCKVHLKSTCTNPSCEKWRSPECLLYKTEEGFKFGDKCVFAHRRVEEQPSKRSKKNGTKSGETMLFRCVFQDMEPPKSSSNLRKSSTMRKPTRCVRFTKAVLRDAKIRDQNPSLYEMCPGDPHQRSPNAPKLEDGGDRVARALGPAKQRESWQRKSWSQRRNLKLHYSRLRNSGAFLHHPKFNGRRKESL